MIKKKLAKVLLSAALVLSVLGNDFFYVGAGNPQEDTTSEVAEGVTNDVVENEQENEIQAEEVQPEENIVPDTPLPEVETEDGQVDSEVTVPDSEPVIGESGEVVESEPVEGAEKEEVLEEAMATLSDEGEEEIPEITDEDLLRNQNSRYENRVNFDDVCRSNKNPNVTVKPFQDPDPVKKYWEYNMDNFQGMYNEKDLIDMLWPKNKGEALHHGYRIDNAVINPDYQCFYANEQNGFGESVSGSEFLKDTYWRYNKDWQKPEGSKQTPRPYGSQKNPQTGKPIDHPNFNDLTYLGNYRWQNNSGGYLFTIVTRPKTRVNLYGNYASPYTGKQVGQYYITGDAHPRIFDVTGKREEEHDIKKSRIMYKFEGINNDRDKVPNGIAFYSKPSHETFNHQGNPWRKTPTKPGWYKMRAQVQEDLDQFILPGIVEDYVIYMKKGYKTKFVKKIDDQHEIQMQDSDWNSGNKPEPFDQETKDLFQIEFYTDDKEHKIPVPKYDESQYIFEGWDVVEQYWQPAYPGAFIGNMKYKTTQLESSGSGNYLYKPTTIDADQHFVLEAKLIAKLRTRKTNTINVKLNFIEDESNLPETQKAELNRASIKLVEAIDNNEQFTVALQDKPFEFVGYSKTADGTSPLSTNPIWKPGEKNSQMLPDNQLQTHVTTDINAVVRPKSMIIHLDPNGGQIKGGGKQLQDIQTYYYKSPKIDVHDLVNGDLVLKGWSETKGGAVDVITGGTYKVEDKKVGGQYPSEKTLYAVWGKATATVHAEKYKDVLFYPTAEGAMAAKNIYTSDGDEIRAYELGRFYFNVEPADHSIGQDQSKLDSKKFFVVFEHSYDGRKWRKIDFNDASNGAIVTKAFSNSKTDGFAKVIYDKQKKQWFAPLLGRLEKMNDENSYKGFYRVNVAYDDVTAAEKVSTEEEFFYNTGSKGWSESNDLQLRVVQNPSAFINVPSSITLEEKTVVDSGSGTSKEIIESIHKSNKVMVEPFEHEYEKKTDYDWITTNNALVNGKTGSYNEHQHEEFIKNKPFYVSMSWNKTLADSTGRYQVNNIEMYSASNIGGMQTDQIIQPGTKRSFTYDGTNSDKTLFDFYLKGDKPKGLPEGLQLKGTITFTVSPVAQ